MLADEGDSPGLTPSAALDADEGVHVVYGTYVTGDLRYAYCPGPCDGTGWTAVSLVEAGDVGSGSVLAIGADGRLHVTYVDRTRNAIAYATCASDCTVAANWALSDVEQLAPGEYLASPAIAVDPAGFVETVYPDPPTGWLRSARCALACGGGPWTITGISRQHPASGYPREPSLVIDAAGVRHVAWTGRDARIVYMRY